MVRLDKYAGWKSQIEIYREDYFQMIPAKWTIIHKVCIDLNDDKDVSAIWNFA